MYTTNEVTGLVAASDVEEQHGSYNLHGDFALILKELEWAGDYPDAINLTRFKWLLLYHTHNFDLRVYSYIEKLYKLINIVLKLGVSEQQGFRKAVRSALVERKYSELNEHLMRFEGEPPVRNASNRRHTSQHGLVVNDPKWPSLHADSLVLEAVAAELDPDSHRLGELEQAPNLRAFAKEKGDELSGILGLIEGLRVAICGEMQKLGV